MDGGDRPHWKQGRLPESEASIVYFMWPSGSLGIVISGGIKMFALDYTSMAAHFQLPLHDFRNRSFQISKT